MTTHTFEQVAVLPGYGPSPDELIAGEQLDVLVYRELDFKPGSSEFTKDYSIVGKATITVEILSKDEMIENKVVALQDALAADLANSEVRQNAIRNQISKLLALTNEVQS